MNATTAGGSFGRIQQRATATNDFSMSEDVGRGFSSVIRVCETWQVIVFRILKLACGDLID